MNEKRNEKRNETYWRAERIVRCFVGKASSREHANKFAVAVGPCDVVERPVVFSVKRPRGTVCCDTRVARCIEDVARAFRTDGGKSENVRKHEAKEMKKVIFIFIHPLNMLRATVLMLAAPLVVNAGMLWDDVCTQSDTKGLPFCDMSQKIEVSLSPPSFLLSLAHTMQTHMRQGGTDGNRRGRSLRALFFLSI